MASTQKAQSGAKPGIGQGSSSFAKEHSVNINNNEASSATRLLDALLYLLLPGMVLIHLGVAPYTKVEESFNIQAAHDVLVYGTPTSDIYHKLSATYDHFAFPGAVPRTFIGPVLLAGLAQPVVTLVGFQHAQFIVRAILGLFNAASLLIFARSLRWAYGAGAARWYLLLQASQFHIMFYASRTLPNMFAFGLTTLAFSYLLPNPSNPKSTAGRHRLSITMFVFAAAVFRSEVALLLGTTVLHQLIIPSLSLQRVIFPFTASFLVALATSVPIDSYFWQRPLWPELWGFYYNVVQGSSSNWGISPWHYYFSSALPRLLLNPLTYTLLIPFSLYHPALHRGASRLITPCLLFIVIYSLQPHKETRFIFYVVPPLTAAAALSANFFSTPSRWKKSPLAAILAAVLALSVLGSLAASTAMLALSALNYPGGEALAHLRATVLSSPQDGGIVPVHADVLSCMTGVTLFGTSTAESISSAAEAALSASRARWASLSDGESHTPDTTTSSGSGTDTTRRVKMSPSKPQQPPQNTNHGTPPILALDKTEFPSSLLAQPSFWSHFTYLLLEDPSKPTGGEWETIAVVQSYAGIEILKPGDSDSADAPKTDTDNDTLQTTAPPVIGLGKTVATWRRRVRALTGGWWIGPRMVERVYILRRVDSKDRDSRDGGELEDGAGRKWEGAAVEAR